jgi:outer membrane immunogenic protein
MKKTLFLISTATAMMVAGSAMAADMAYKAAPPPMVPLWSWTGFYLGVNGGGSIGVDNNAAALSGFPAAPGFVNPFLTSTTQRALPGGLIGGTLGWNWQSGAWVWGVEGDWDWSGEKNTSTVTAANIGGVPGVGVSYTDQEKINSIGTARARLGWAHEGFLWYVTGGGAWAQIDNNYTLTSTFPATTFPSPSGASFSTTKGGWTIGGGVETHLAGGWTAKAEYLYADFGTVNQTFATPTTAAGTFSTFTSSHGLTDHIIRLGLNYKFW